MDITPLKRLLKMVLPQSLLAWTGHLMFNALLMSWIIFSHVRYLSPIMPVICGTFSIGLNIIFDFFIFQATWHKGHTLAQTVFTCIYLMRMERTSSHAVLNSFCRTLRATCNAVISVVSTARTHEVMLVGTWMLSFSFFPGHICC